ncbi:hypothetical protein [Serratia sp. NPDC087055]|uniref:hypothetical protein n=1 Tax=Serratia sp. NPDC087055 TaxID=3364516 RepID=UPI00384D951B
MNAVDHDRHAFSDITDFIAQEIYILSVRKKFPLEFDLICQLAKDTKEEFNFVKDEYNEHYAYEDIVEILINSIATKGDKNSLQKEICYHLDNIRLGHEDNDNLFNYIANLKNRVLTSLVRLSEKYCKFSLNFTPQYPPYIFCLNNDYLSALVYYYGKEYLPKEKYTKEGRETCFTNAPYKLRKCYWYSTYRTRHMQHEVDVPENTLKKSIKKEQLIINFKDEQESLIQEFLVMDMLRDMDTVSFTHELRISIDTSAPLDDLAVDKLLAMIRNELSSLQLKNKYSKYILAESMDDLEEASKIPTIKSHGLIDLKELHSSQIPGLTSYYTAKNYLCGLVILHRHLFDHKREGSSLDNLCSDLSEELTNVIKIDNSKFSPVTIIRGYKQVRKLLHNQIKLLCVDNHGPENFL